VTPDELRCGVILTDARGVIQPPNRAAEDMLRAGGAILSSAGVLRVAGAGGGVALQDAIRRAGSPEADIGSASPARPELRCWHASCRPTFSSACAAFPILISA
jgi:hypothetical protein